MACSCDSEDIIETHGDVSDDYSFYSTHEGCSSFVTFLVMFMGPNFSVKFPYHIEQQNCSEKFKSWNLEKKDYSKRKNNSQNRSSHYSPKYRFFSFISVEFFRRHSDKDGVITTHYEIDEDNIEERESSCRCENMCKIRNKCLKHTKKLCLPMVSKIKKMQFFDRIGVLVIVLSCNLSFFYAKNF